MNKTVLVLRYRQIDDFTGVVESAAEERGSTCAMRIPSPVLCIHRLDGIDETEMSEGGQKEKQGIRHIQGTVHRG